MPRRNTTGPSKNRRNSSDASSSQRRSKDDSGGRPFKKSSSTSSRSSSPKKFSGSTGGFSRKPKNDGDERPSRSSGGSSRPFGKRFGSDSSDSARKPKNDSSSRPYKKSSEGSSRPFGKKFNSDSTESGSFSRKPRNESGSRPYKSSGGTSRPFGKKFGDDAHGDSAGKKPFKKSFDDKPFGKRSSDRSSEKPSTPRKYGTRSVGDESKPSGRYEKRSNDSGGFERRKSETRGDHKPSTPRKFSQSGFSDKKSSDNRRPDKFDSKDESKGSFNRKDSQKSNPNYSRPFKRKTTGEHSEKEGGFFSKDVARGRKGSNKEAESSEPTLSDGKIRLNKFIANSGVCSRREADELITMGLISVNGKTITELGYKVNPGDEVRHESKILRAEKPVYILMNKPKGFLTTTTDPQERNTVMQILAGAVKERIYPVGRLDRNTTGLLLFTNDGDLAEKLMHPSYNIKKIYKVELDRPLTKADFERIVEGVHLEEGKAMVDDVAIVSDDGKTVGLEIHIGWNRVVRRIFEALEYTVVKLDRSVYAGLDKKDLPRGHWRFLKQEEIIRLKHYK
jgi:23S rRNA pseudouridine2605 synthase